MDYTKGIDLRLKAFQQVLDDRPEAAREAVFVQLAVPSRERIDEYRDLRRQVEELVGQINGRHGEVGIAVVHYLHRTLPFEELVAMYLAADVMAVTPLRDGMNLVAKEYVATRRGDSGVLLLSEFAGAAAELRTALHVNPHDVDGMAEAMRRALHLPKVEALGRMRAMRRVVRRHTVHRWARSFLSDLRG
jgi:trehalose-6-phosphate synthase